MVSWLPVRGQAAHITPCHVFQEVETDGQEVSDWEKYAAEEYDILVAEEAANDQCNNM